jgi:hypothetical protein
VDSASIKSLLPPPPPTACACRLSAEITAPTATSDRVCSASRVCSSFEYELRAPTATSTRVCAAYTICTASEWESIPPTLTSDRVCSAITICTALEYQIAAATATSNAVCALLTVCTTNQYIQPTYTSNCVCAAYTVCAAGSFVFQLPTATSDRVCRSCGCSPNAQCVGAGGSILGVSTTCPAIGAELTTVCNTTHRCVCNAGFAGDGFNCGIDSDSDGITNQDLPPCALLCLRCKLDVCPANANVFCPIFINRVAEVLSSRQWQWHASSFATEGQPNWVVSGDGLFSGQRITQLSSTVPTATSAAITTLLVLTFPPPCLSTTTTLMTTTLASSLALPTNPACTWRSGRSVTSHL